MGPIDYYGQTSPILIGDGIKAGYNEVRARQQAELAAQQAAEEKARIDAQRAQYDEALADAIANPSAKAYARLILLNPKEHEGIQKAWGALDKDQQEIDLHDMTAVRGFIAAGRPQEATAVLNRRIAADKAAGQDTSDDEQIVALIASDPKAAGGFVDYTLAGVMGPEKWSTTFETIGQEGRADAAAPLERNKLGAETRKLEADARLTGVQADVLPDQTQAEIDLKAAQVANYASAISERAERLALDRDTLQTNTELELEKLATNQAPLSATGEKQVFDAVSAAESSRQLASRAEGLADRIATTPLGPGGSFASLKEAGAGMFGKQDAVSALRREYTGVMSSQAVKNLPPGPASDKDIQLALKGFPPPTANAETLASFLRGMAKLQRIAASRDQAKADWISGNGNIGTAKRDLVVNGVRVPAGSTFADFSNSQAATERKDAAGERSYMRFGQ